MVIGKAGRGELRHDLNFGETEVDEGKFSQPSYVE